MRNLMLNEAMDSVIVRDPEIMSGEPTFRGTRVLLRTLFDYIEAGHTLEGFLEGVLKGVVSENYSIGR